MASSGEKLVTATALGEGLDKSGVLSEIAMERTLRAISDFKLTANGLGEYVETFATEAVRSAINGADFVKRVEALGVPVKVLTGEEEALVGYLGATGGKGGAVIDVGGASTEVVFGEGDKIIFSTSMKIGIVRARDTFGSDYEALGAHVASLIKSARIEKKTEEVIALGGTAISLAAIDSGEEYDRRNTHLRKIAVERITELQNMLAAMTREERLALKGLHSSRVDTVVGGAKIIETVVKALGAKYIVTSESDNLEGYNMLFRSNR